VYTFKLDVRDKKKIRELDRLIIDLSRNVLRELEKKGFNIDFHFLWKLEWWKTDRVDWEEVPVSVEVKVYITFSTVDGKRYKATLAKLTRDFREYEVNVELYEVEEVVKSVEEIP
jgi:hypothetical protein